jgi:cytochrome c oxidase cbb3-type subunit 3
MTEETKSSADSPIEETHHEGHDFDGIRELNNPAPNWIVLVFLVTIGFSLLYAVKYFGYPDNGKDQTSEYQSNLAEFELQKKQKQLAANPKEAMSQQESLAAGAKLFAEKGCIACHGTKGEGNNIGPNLTDTYWLNGCSNENVVQIITEGKPEKGMTPFKTMMTQEQIKNLATYILEGLAGTNPENAKKPQGEECNP